MLTATFLAALLAPAADPPKEKNPFEFADGDRVVFLGGTLIEREQKYGYWELALTLLNKDKNVTFRNLGWSGDTVWCESRGSFDGPKKGFENTIALVKELKPTVILICYGQVESFDGKDGVKKFTEGLEKLIDGVSGAAKARIVLMTPTPFENVKPITDAKEKNENLKLYATAMKGVAEKRKLEVVDLLSAIERRWTPSERLTLTENGLHLKELGYADTCPEFGVDPFGGKSKADELDRQVMAATALRQAIVAKNELFFHRWRPQNITYLTGFRKGEQGQNAKEIAQFDPLVEKAEKQIAELKAKVK